MEKTSVSPHRAGQAQSLTTVSDVVGKRVFLAWTTPDVADIREHLKTMLEKAGLEVYPKEAISLSDPTTFQKAVEEALNYADFSIHIFGGEFGSPFNGFPSPLVYQYERAVQTSKVRKGLFKVFVWSYLPERGILEGELQEFLTEIQSTLSRDLVYTTTRNPANFIEDIRAYLSEVAARERVATKTTDIAWVSTVNDAASCYELVERIQERYRVKTLTVEFNTDFRAEAIDLVRKSRLVIVYFRESVDWAVAFTQLVWKAIGGLSSQTQFLILGDNTLVGANYPKFRAPGVKMEVVPPDQLEARIHHYFRVVQEGGSIQTHQFVPYIGLRPFTEEESIFFRGRDQHVEAILKQLREKKFVMVTGASGDGKSSLIFAGVLPSIRAGFLPSHFNRWRIATFRPERTPLENFANSICEALDMTNREEVEEQLSYGFSALVDLYKGSSYYLDLSSQAYVEASESERIQMRKRAANLLILVDQFEEFFTNEENYRDGVPSPSAQITVNVLLETVRIAQEENLPIYVIFTMRSDYVGQCVAFRHLAEMIGSHSYFIPRLTRQEIEQVIEDPAHLNGNEIELRLTQRLLNDAGEGTDQLPVLQHALHQIWTLFQQDNEPMDLIHYAKVGGLGVNRLPKSDRPRFQKWLQQLPEAFRSLYERPQLRNVLNRHANELFLKAHLYYNSKYNGNLSPEDAQFVIKQAFICLTKIDENRAVRNRMTLRQITQIIGREEYDEKVVCRVLNLFRLPGNTFIQPFIGENGENEELDPGTVLDITHEALIRNWTRLSEWAEEEYRSAQIFLDFKTQVDRWLDHDKSPQYLLALGPYTYYSNWFESQKPTPAWILRYLPPEELDPDIPPLEYAEYYLEDIIEFLEESRKRIERNRRLLLFLLGLISFLLLLSLFAAYYAWEQRNEAIKQKAIAEQKAYEAEQQRIIAENNAREALNQRLMAERALLMVEQQRLLAEQQRLIAEGERYNAELQRQYAENQRRVAEYQKKIAENQRIIAENQRRLAVAAQKTAEESEKEALLQAEIARRQRNNALILQSLFLAYLAEDQVNKKSPEVGMLLALEGLPQDLNNPDRPYVEETEAALFYALNAMLNHNPYKVLTGHKNHVVYTQFSPDGRYLISTSWDKTARLWDIHTEEMVGIFKGHKHIVEKASFSEDGKYFLTVGEDYTARLWDFDHKDIVAIFRGHADAIVSARLSRTANWVVTSSIDGTAILFNAKNGNIERIFRHHVPVLYADFTLDDQYVISADAEGNLRLWEVKTGKEVKSLQAHSGAIPFFTISLNNKYLVTVSDDGAAKLWTLPDLQLKYTLQGHNGKVLHADFSPDAKRVAIAGEDGHVSVWNVLTGKQEGLLKEHKQRVYHVQFSPDGRFIATSSDDGTIRLWDAEYFVRLAIYHGNPGDGYHPAFSPDGNFIATAGVNHRIVVYKLLPQRQELLNLAYQLKKRDLTPNERKKFFLADERVKAEILEQRLQERKERKRYQEEVELLPVPPDPEPPKLIPVPGMKRPEIPEPVSSSPQPSDPNLPPFHIVQQGETLYSIAKKYGLPVEKLKSLNGLTSEEIYIGQKLKLK